MPATLSELANVTNCEIDAIFLGDPEKLEEAAVAHRRALLRHLGMDPTDGGVADGDADGDGGFEDAGPDDAGE